MPSIYLDTCIVIYVVERHPQYAPLIAEAFAANAGAVYATSSLVSLETLVKPRRQNDDAILKRYEQFLSAQYFLPIADEIFERALDLRVDNNLKVPDALHLATAVHYGCTQFWTNDGRLDKAAKGYL